MTPPPFSEMVAIGRVVKPQGRKGEVLVQPCSDRPERFPALRAAYVPGENGAARGMAVPGGRQSVSIPT